MNTTIFHQSHNSKNDSYNLSYYHNIKFLPHLHSSPEFIYVKSGKVELITADKTEILSAGDYAIVLSNQVHAYETAVESESYVIVFSESIVPKFAAVVKNKYSESAKFRCEASIDLFLQSKLFKDDLSPLMKKACLYALCDEFLNTAVLTERPKSDTLIGEVIDFISLHFKEDISLKTVADRFGYEYHYISRLLNKNYRFNFREMLNEYRIAEAKELLLNKKMHITDIASECGFQSIRSFNSIFKRIVGCTPREYS